MLDQDRSQSSPLKSTAPISPRPQRSPEVGATLPKETFAWRESELSGSRLFGNIRTDGFQIAKADMCLLPVAVYPLQLF